jgi:hypothetical protein
MSYMWATNVAIHIKDLKVLLIKGCVDGNYMLSCNTIKQNRNYKMKYSHFISRMCENKNPAHCVDKVQELLKFVQASPTVTAKQALLTVTA